MTDVWSARAQAMRESPTHREGPDLDLVVEWCEPAAGVQAIDVTTGGQPVARHELEPFTWSLIEEFRRRGANALPWARATFAKAVEVYVSTVAKYDVMLTPTLAVPPWRIGSLSPFLSCSLLSPLLFRLLSCSFSFFFYCSGYHRSLHSFLTRRSSDLARRHANRGGAEADSQLRDHRPARQRREGAPAQAIQIGRAHV